MSSSRRGLAYGAAAYLVWGLFPLFWPLLKPAGAVEILAHRVVWSLVVVVVILAVQRRWRWISAPCCRQIDSTLARVFSSGQAIERIMP